MSLRVNSSILNSASTVFTGSNPQDNADSPRGARPTSVGLAAWIGLVLICEFLFTKVEFATEGTGWTRMPAIGLCLWFVVTARRKAGERFVEGSSLFCAGLFYGYFVVRLALDSPELSEFIGYSVSYSHGVIFGFTLGLVCRVFLDTLSARINARHALVFGLGFVALNLWLLLQVWARASEHEDVHKRFAFVVNSTYQDSAIYLAIIAILVAGVLARTAAGVESGTRVARGAGVVALLLASWFTVAASGLTQFLGSNAGPAYMIPVGIIGISCLLLRPTGMMRQSGGGTKPETAILTLFRPLAIQWLWKAALVLVIVITIGLAALWAGVLDPSAFRAFGFGEFTVMNSSVVSRRDLFTENFMTHLAHAPVLGDMFVDRKTTGSGTYVHSLLSIVPHLGLVGSGLFICYALSAARQMSREWMRGRREWREACFVICGVGLLVSVATLSTAMTFFTAIPLWFSFGLFAPVIEIRRRCPKVVTRGR